MGQTPITHQRARSAAIGTALQLTAYYAIAISIWGIVFKHIFWFALAGIIIGILVSAITAPVVSMQRTVERAEDMMFAIGSIWGGLAIIIGIVGLVAFLIRIIFFI